MKVEGYCETAKPFPDQQFMDRILFHENHVSLGKELIKHSFQGKGSFIQAERECVLALTVSFCLMDIIFADGSTSSTLPNGKCAPGLHVQTCVGYAQSIGSSTLIKLIQIISKLTGVDSGNELELKKILLQILLWH